MFNMSKKPEVCFDANNKEHREAFYYFFKHSAWGDSPRFALEWPFANIPSMIQHKLLDYYMQQDLSAPKTKKVNKETK